MKFVVIAWDGPDGAAIRDVTRAAHFSYIEKIVGRVWLGGPMKDDAGRFTGSLLIYEAETRADAEALLHDDPYFKAGLWDRWSLHPFLAAAGEWAGGKIW
jgi:uncharacterized protein